MTESWMITNADASQDKLNWDDKTSHFLTEQGERIGAVEMMNRYFKRGDQIIILNEKNFGNEEYKMTNAKYDEEKEYLLKDTHELKIIGNKKLVKYSSEKIMNFLLDESMDSKGQKAKYVSPFFLLPPIKGDADIVFGYHTFSENNEGIETKMLGESEIISSSTSQKLFNIVI